MISTFNISIQQLYIIVFLIALTWTETTLHWVHFYSSNMDHVKEFLDNSTIHGLSFISSTRRWSRLFWILVVIGGFSGAGYMIYTSFHNWGQSPISTTIETLPISELTLPNVTVCPPKS